MKEKLTYIDLFAGAGGLSEGFQANGFFPISHVEMNKFAAETLKTRIAYYHLKENNNLELYNGYLRKNVSKDELFNTIPKEKTDTVINEEISSDTIKSIYKQIDEGIKRTNANKIDIIVGGPPCQAYSVIGRARDKNKMQNDSRNYLYLQYLEFLKQYSPDLFVFENVPGILTANKGDIIKSVLEGFDKVGYEVKHKIMNALDFGVLQNRKRVIIIGIKKGKKLTYPEYEIKRSNALVNDILKDLSPLKPGECRNMYVQEPSNYLLSSGIRSADDVLTLHQARPNIERDRKIYKLCIEAWDKDKSRIKYTDLPKELRTHKNDRSFLDRFKVVAGDLDCSHTLTAHISKDGHHFIHPDINQIRSLSVREAARIQSFPDNFFFEGPRTAQFVQIGNAVPPLMAEGIAKVIKENF